MIYTVTLNPAIDQIIKVNAELTRGKNNRIVKSLLDVGGKGTHVSIVLSILGTPNIATGFAGQNNKETFDHLLRQNRVEPQFHVLEGESIRENLVLMDQSNQGSYMLTHVGSVITTKQIDQFSKALCQKINKTEDIVVFSGNPPKTMSTDDYLALIKKVQSTGVRTVIDASGSYLQAAISSRPTMIKPNQFELSEFLGKNIITVEDCVKVQSDIQLLGVEFVVITLGQNGSVLFHQDNIYQVVSPKVNTVNDTGCGDAFVGGLVFGLYHDFSIEDMLTLASAIGASKAKQFTSSGFDVEELSDLENLVKVMQLK